MFTAALLTRAKRWNHLKCPPTDEWIFTRDGTVSSLQEEGDADTGYGVGGP